MINSFMPHNYNVLRFCSNSKNEKKPSIFIAMPMPSGEQRKKWNKLNDTIQSIAKEKGAEAGRIDDIMRRKMKSTENNFLVHEIMREIDNADFVIADVSEQKPNVYFELGYAMGKGKKVFPIAKKGTVLPFDIKSLWTTFYHQFYYKKPGEGKPSDLQLGLGENLKAAIKDWEKNTNEAKRSVK